jgi:hypothetical protein
MLKFLEYKSSFKVKVKNQTTITDLGLVKRNTQRKYDSPRPGTYMYQSKDKANVEV